MADTANTGAEQQLHELLGQFVDTNYINRHIDVMFKPVVTRIQADLGKKDFTLFSLFFSKQDISELKTHIKDNFTKIVKNIKADTILPAKSIPLPKASVAPIKQQVVYPKSVSIESPLLASLVEKIEQTNVQNEERNTLFQTAVNTIVGTLKAKQPQQRDDRGRFIKTPAKSTTTETTKDVIKSKSALNVNIVGISPDAVKLLSNLLKPKTEKTEKTPETKQSSGDLLGKLIAAALAGFSAYKLLQAAWDNKGPLRGSLELIGLVLTKAATSLFKGVLSGISSFAKLLPESIVKRLFQGEASLLGKSTALIKNVVEKISTHIGGVLARFGNVIIESIAKISPSAAKVVSNFAGGLLKLTGKIGGFLAKRLKVIPLIGPLITTGFAIKRMSDGDYVGGLIELGGGLLGLLDFAVPGLGTALNLVTDLFLAGRDIKYGGIQNLKNSNSNQWIRNFGNALLETGPIRWLRNVGTALGQIFTGQIREGLAGLGNTIGEIPGMGYVYSIFGATKNNEGKYFTPENFDIIEKIKNEISAKFEALWGWGKKIVDKVRNFFGLGKTTIEAKTDSEQAVQLRKKLAELRDKEHEEQTKQYAFADSKVKALNDIAVERSKLESQLNALIKKTKDVKKQQENAPKHVESEAVNSAYAEPEPDTEIIPVPQQNNVAEVRETAIKASTHKTDNSDKIVAAIRDLKKSQTSSIQTTAETKKDSPINVISSVNNNFRPMSDVNVDTARDSVFIARKNIRSYLMSEQAMI